MSGIITFTVNGRPVQADEDGATPLLDVLRNTLGLTGARYGCGQELCGACAVLVDGVPAYACSRELWSVAGRSVTTIEGLAGHPIIAAILAEQAGQCGYCLSGIAIAATALLAANPSPTRAEIAEALAPHLCRCGAHPRILRAVARAADVLRSGAPT
jgi:nicotinate dehydrogenase subunit A